MARVLKEIELTQDEILALDEAIQILTDIDMFLDDTSHDLGYYTNAEKILELLTIASKFMEDNEL